MKVCCDKLIKYLTNSQHNTEIAVYVIESNVSYICALIIDKYAHNCILIYEIDI